MMEIRLISKRQKREIELKQNMYALKALKVNIELIIYEAKTFLSLPNFLHLFSRDRPHVAGNLMIL